MFRLGGAAVLVGLLPRARASFELVLTGFDGRIPGSNYGSIRPARDMPVAGGPLRSRETCASTMVTAGGPRGDAGDALEQLATGAPSCAPPHPQIPPSNDSSAMHPPASKYAHNGNDPLRVPDRTEQGA